MQHYTDLVSKLPIMDFRTVKTRGKEGVTYYNIEAGFDIETTSFITPSGEKSAFMYIWMFGIEYGKPTYYGRTWEEFTHLCASLKKRFNLGLKCRFVVYVHNLGYEFQFMRKHFKWVEVFSASERNPFYAVCEEGIEFRDSYKLSGYSLAGTAKNLTKHKIKKMDGDLDYDLIRTNLTTLTEKEMKYCDNDIQVILAYINEQIEQNGDIAHIPTTNTGRVRRYVRDICHTKNVDGTKASKNKYTRYRQAMESLTLTAPIYKQLKQAFIGGFTHANANYSGKLLKNVSSIDFTSSYPAVMISEKFPMSTFKPEQVKSITQFEELCARKAVVFDVKIDGVEATTQQENYLSESKCRNLINPVINNGRIVSADSLITTMTEVDYGLLKNTYKYEKLSFANVHTAIKGYLPKSIIEAILKLYQNKTELKDVEGSEVEYMHSKGMLNSIYGMCVTDIVKDQAEYIEDNWETSKPDVESTIEKYNSSKNRFLYYAWGIWITAYARYNLWTGIFAVGSDYVYSDTDSLKMLNFEKHQKYIAWYNKAVLSKMYAMCDHYELDKSLLSPKTKDGVEKTIGIWDFEGTYPRFKTLGAKRYMVEHKGTLKLTVAGLSKQEGMKHMIESCEGDFNRVFEMFTDDLHIPANKTGKLTHSYIDSEMTFRVTDYQGNETTVTTLSGVHMEPCEFTLSISEKYEQYLSDLSNGYFNTGVHYK